MGPSQDRLAPGWSVEDGKPTYDPNDRVGGHTDHENKDDEHEHEDSPAEPPATDR